MNGSRSIVRFVASLACVALLGGCGAGPSASPGTSPSLAGASASPTPASTEVASPPLPTFAPLVPASATDVTAWQAAAAAFADRFNELYDNAPEAFAAFTDDARILDPSNADFEIGPKSVIVSSWQGWMAGVDSYGAKTLRVYVSRSAAVVLTDVTVAWPSGEDALTPPLVHEARIFRFSGVPAADVTTFELWYRLDGLEAGKGTCFELRGCGPALRAFIDRYLKAWSQGNPAAITALYADGASFNDSVLAIEAQGPAAIAALAGSRYGSSGGASCALRGTFAVTNDGDPAVSDWDNPDGGKVAGVTLVTSCVVGPGKRAVESAFVLMLGTLTPAGFELDPAGRIVREEVFHDATSLARAGVVR